MLYNIYLPNTRTYVQWVDVDRSNRNRRITFKHNNDRRFAGLYSEDLAAEFASLINKQYRMRASVVLPL